MSSVARIKLPVKGIDQKSTSLSISIHSIMISHIFITAAEDLLLWKDVKKTGLAFGGACLDDASSFSLEDAVYIKT